MSDVDGGRSSIIRAKAHEKLSTLAFKTQVNLPDPLEAQEQDTGNLHEDSSISHSHNLTTATRVTPFTELEFYQPSGIQSRRVLSVLSSKNDYTREGSNEESALSKLDELRKRPKVIDNKHVWETLSNNERSSLFD